MSTNQNEDRQVLDLLESGSKSVISMWTSRAGRSFERTNYMSLRKQHLRNGDILVVKSIDRFGRNYSGIRCRVGISYQNAWRGHRRSDTPILDTTRYKDLLGSVITDIVLAVLSFGAQLKLIPSRRHRQKVLPPRI